MLVRKIARPLLASVFIGQGLEALRRPQQAAQTARPAWDGLKEMPEPIAANVPSDAETFAKVNAAVQVGAGLLLATGRLPRIASTVLAGTVVPGRMGAHMFWTETDPQRKAEQRRDFFVDLSLIGGLMIAAVDTGGKPSLGWRARQALPGGSDTLETFGDKVGAGLHTGVERGRELAETASEKAAPYLEVARDRGTELAHVARERAADLAEVGGARGAEFAEVAAERGAEWADAAREGATELSGAARRGLRRRFAAAR
ncbi:DoxX family protein [Mycolicibacillus parakoreensis]|uniref:DoxX family protein n=1 Tax=Mycolicibacillus parakoreensis TaxID=1069221 RepID=A0ABY3U500_9MYCO|nr:DoxX family protein [Mycolicibacillus parakoreensis]MCV7314650.1 DoxX family protein [Mycolicibacillus parakoreensis]ULN53035.1 DoxX family protein [Mycolicibacillus parakoreensis]